MDGPVGRWRPLVLKGGERGGYEPLVERGANSPKEYLTSTRESRLCERLHKASARAAGGGTGFEELQRQKSAVAGNRECIPRSRASDLSPCAAEARARRAAQNGRARPARPSLGAAHTVESV